MKITWLTVVALIAAASWAHAQDYPSTTVRIIVPFSPGAGTDTLTRLVANEIGQRTGFSLYVENQTGAGGLIGMSTVARATPNGYTLGIASPSTHTISAAIRKKMPYDPIRDFSFISTLVKYTSVLVIHPSVPLKSMAEFVRYAKDNPDRLSFASAGVGTSTHLMGEMLKQAAQIKIVHVPYKGGGASIHDLLGGHIPVAIISAAGVQNYIREGRLRALAVFERERYRGLPTVPPITEAVPRINPRISWFGILGPAGLSPAIVRRWNTEVLQALQSKDLRQKLEDAGFQLLGGTPEQFAAMVKDEIEAWTKVVAAANIKGVD